MKNFVKLAIHFTEYKIDLNQLEIKRYIVETPMNSWKVSP